MAGHHEVRVNVNSRDEVGQLAQDFNRMASTLERNEGLRRAFIADVSHELRTPLSVLRGELEALEDGIRPLDRAAVASLQGEIIQLGQLVEDLYELALSDVGALTYRMERVDLAALLTRVAGSHDAGFKAAGLRLAVSVPEGPAPVQADAGRLQQLLDNLLENSRRYTEAPGYVRLSLSEAAMHWQIDLHDSAPGLPGEQLAHLFERFFRAESSRNRATGGAGLGLAIGRNIVLAHGGQIEADASPEGGYGFGSGCRHRGAQREQSQSQATSSSSRTNPSWRACWPTTCRLMATRARWYTMAWPPSRRSAFTRLRWWCWT
jgi:two-component system sensor histidine kinase BaeS